MPPLVLDMKFSLPGARDRILGIILDVCLFLTVHIQTIRKSSWLHFRIYSDFKHFSQPSSLWT